MVKFKEVSHERFWEMLEILPPVAQSNKGFMVGEPWRHNELGYPMFAPFLFYNGKYYEGDGPMTISEFKMLDPKEVI